MCLILFAYRVLPGMPLIVAANRDEFYDRPAQSAHFWPDAPAVLAGRDKIASGTWLGVNRRGHFAAITNFASADLQPLPAAPTNEASQPTHSRGALASNFLHGHIRAMEYARALRGGDYEGFNLLLWDGETLVCTSNRGPTQALEPGYHGLTNAEFGARWPKVVDGIESLRRVVNQAYPVRGSPTPSAHGIEPSRQIAQQGPMEDAIIKLLRNDRTASDDRLPRRGQPLEFERRIAPCFIVGEDYGTRASTAVICATNETTLTEQGYGRRGRPLKRVRFQLSLR